MKYPSLDDIEAMRAGGYDRSVIEQQEVLYRRDATRRGALAESIRERIRRAFAGVRPGSGVGLWEAQGIDDYADAATCAAYRAKDDWSLIPVADLNRCYSSPSFFDAAGTCLPLPAFMADEPDQARDREHIQRALAGYRPR